ncbi:MAG: hypothetical protein AAF716_15355 [Cyanobacteria bacterium P01_D01_bin.1]
MSERLDRIESILAATVTHVATTDARLDRIAAIVEESATQQRQNTVDIDNLLGALSTTDVEVRRINETVESLSRTVERLGEAVAANEQRFNILIQEMRADRRASQQSFQQLLLSLANVNGRIDDLEQAS